MYRLFNALRACKHGRCAWPFLVVLLLLIPYNTALALSPSFTSGSQAGPASTGTVGQRGGGGLKRWTATPSLQLEGLYVNRGGEIAPGESHDSFVTEVNPQLSVTGRSPRASLNLKYRMQNVFYVGHSAADSTFHQLNAVGKTTLISNFLFFDAASHMSQQIISPTARLYLGNFSVSHNRTDVRTYSLSPYIHYNFGTTAGATVRYSRHWLTYSKRGQYNNSANIYSASLSSGPSFDRLSWGLSAYEENITYNAYPGITFESVQGQLGWLLSRSVTVYATGGYDRNHYVSLNRSTQGKLWSVGFTWSPGIRTSLSASYGRRYFGNTYSLKFNHRSHFMAWSASYSVSPSTIRGFQNSSAVIGLINPSGQVSLVNFLVPRVTQQVFISKRGQLAVSRAFRAGSMAISVYDTKRVYQQTGEHTEYYGARGSLTRKIGRRSKATLHGAWVRYKYQGGSYNYWYAGVSFNHQLSRTVSGSLRYLYSDHAGRGGTGGYSINVAAVYINVKL